MVGPTCPTLHVAAAITGTGTGTGTCIGTAAAAAHPLPCLTVGRAFGGVAKVEHLSGGGVDLGVRSEGVVHLAAATRQAGAARGLW